MKTWPFHRKRHLKYDSIEAWMEGEGVPHLKNVADPRLRDKYTQQYNELRLHLYEKHIATLTVEEQDQFAKGTHPSQSHRFADRAKPFAAELQRLLETKGLTCTVEVGFQQMDRIVLSVDLPGDPGQRRNELPWLFRGFEVKYSRPPR